MAALATVTVAARQPIGNRYLITGTASVTSTAGHVTKESMNIAYVNSVIGVCGGTTTPSSNQAVANTQDQSTEDANEGDLSLDSSASVTATFAVLGR